MGVLDSLQQLQKARSGTPLCFCSAPESESSYASHRLPTSSTVYKLPPPQALTKHTSCPMNAVSNARPSGNTMTPDILRSATLMTNFVVHRRLRSSGQKHPQSQSTTSGSILRPISSDPKGLRAVRASLSSRVDLGHVAYWTLIVTSAVFLPYSLAIVSGYEPAVRTVSSGEAKVPCVERKAPVSASTVVSTLPETPNSTKNIL